MTLRTLFVIPRREANPGSGNVLRPPHVAGSRIAPCASGMTTNQT